MRSRLLATLAALVMAVGIAVLPGTAAHAAAATSAGGRTLVYFEKTPANAVIFVPACIPGPTNPTCDPRGAGSWFASTSPVSYTQGGAQIGTVQVFCLTTRKVGADYFGFCSQVITTPEGVFSALGEINESGLERFEPQYLAVISGGIGLLQVHQIVYPDEFKLTLWLA